MARIVIMPPCGRWTEDPSVSPQESAHRDFGFELSFCLDRAGRRVYFQARRNVQRVLQEAGVHSSKNAVAVPLVEAGRGHLQADRGEADRLVPLLGGGAYFQFLGRQAPHIEIFCCVMARAGRQGRKEQFRRCHSGILATVVDGLVRYYRVPANGRFELFSSSITQFDIHRIVSTLLASSLVASVCPFHPTELALKCGIYPTPRPGLPQNVAPRAQAPGLLGH